MAQAKEQTTLYNRAYFRILKAFGISGRNPVEAEIAFMKKWLKEYGFSMELITEACSRTISDHPPAQFPLRGQDSHRLAGEADHFPGAAEVPGSEVSGTETAGEAAQPGKDRDPDGSPPCLRSEPFPQLPGAGIRLQGAGETAHQPVSGG